MTAHELFAIFDETCREYGVTHQEIRFGSTMVYTTSPNAQYSVTLARMVFLHRAWRAEAPASLTASMLRMASRSVRGWFADFRARQARRAA